MIFLSLLSLLLVSPLFLVAALFSVRLDLRRSRQALHSRVLPLFHAPFLLLGVAPVFSFVEFDLRC